MRTSRQEYPENILSAITGRSSFDQSKIEDYMFFLENIMDTILNMREKKILIERYKYGKSLAAISDEMESTIENARKLEAKALRKLRNPKYMIANIEEISNDQ